MPTNKKNMSDLLNKKAPVMLRQTINPIDIIDAAGRVPEREKRPEQTTEKPIEQEEQQKQLEKTIEKTDTQISSDQPVDQSDRPISPESAIEKIDQEISQEKTTDISHIKKRVANSQHKTDRNNRTKKPRIYSERDIQALLAVEKREKTRYSFEAFADQKEDIQRVCDLYEESTGQHLSASRLLRELLDSFLPGAIKTFEKTDR